MCVFRASNPQIDERDEIFISRQREEFRGLDNKYRVERQVKGEIPKTRRPKSVLRCTEEDLRNRIRNKYEMGLSVDI